jgi:hypothetical protein
MTEVDNFSIDERIRQLHEPIWIGYSRAIEIRETLEHLFAHPKTHRMPNLAIIGETNNGKTMLLNSFLKRHPPINSPEIEKPALPVLMCQTPPEPDEARLYNALLEQVFANGSGREPADSKLYRLKVILRDLNTQMIFLDEFQHSLAGPPTKQKRFLNALKYLGNELQIPMVVSGTQEGLNALQSDPQIANRFEPVFLPKWKLDEDFLRLLASIERVLKLKHASHLSHPEMAKLILEQSEGTIGEMMRLIRLLAAHAIRTEVDVIKAEMITDKSLRKLGWRQPSARTRYPM